MKHPVARPGANRTGLKPHPDLLREMVEGTHEFGPTSHGGPDSIAQVRIRYAREAEPHGTMPPAAEVPAVRIALLDRLGARLQFERTGTRLYEALISKHDALGGFDGGPDRDDLRQLRDDEHHHALLAQTLIRQLGGDPTAMTPAASLQATATRGVIDVIVDPRTTLIEGLDAILIAELADHESWQMLAAAFLLAGERPLAAQVEEAEHTEQAHLSRVRTWLTAANRARPA
jgi:hypothetical protein